jgi:hypothetical protein
MRKFVVGLIMGFLLATTIGVAASSNIRLIVNGQEITPDVPPQIIDGRVMVPARFVAEPLGAKVEWDGENNAVIITNNSKPDNSKPEQNNLIHGKELHDTYGVSITLIDPRATPITYTLSRGGKTIETTEYYIIEDKLYFNKNVLDLLLIQR